MVTTNPNAHKITLVMELTDRNVAAGLLKAKRDVKKFYADVNKDPGVRRGKQDIAPDASNLRASREEIDRINKSLERHKQVQPRRGIGFVNQRGEVIGGGPSPRGMGGRGMVSAVGQPLNMAPFQEDITDMTKALKSNTREMSRATGMLRQPQARMTTAPDPGFQRGPLFPLTPLRRSDGGNPLSNARSESMYANEKLIELQRLRKEAKAAAGGAKKPPARPPAPPVAPAPGERPRGLPFAIEPRHKRGFAMAEQLMSDLGTGQGGDVRGRLGAIHRTAYGAERLRGVNLGDIMAQAGLPAGTSAEDFRRMADEVAGEAGARRSASARTAGRAGAAGRGRRGRGGDIGAMFEDLKKILGPPPPNVRKLSKSLGDKMQALEGYRRTYGEGPDLDALERSLKIGGTRGALLNELKEAGMGQDDANRMIQAQERLFSARSKYESFTDDLDPKRKKALDSQFREYNKLMDRQGEFKGMFDRGQITEAERATRTTGLGLGRRRYDLIKSLDQLQDVAGLAPADRVSPVDVINDQYMRHQEQMAEKQESAQRRQDTREARDRTSQRRTLPALRTELEKGFKKLDALKGVRAAGGISSADFTQRAGMLGLSDITADYRREFDRRHPQFPGGGRAFLKESVIPEIEAEMQKAGAQRRGTGRQARQGLKGMLDATREPYLKEITRLSKTTADPWQDVINKYELSRMRRQASQKEIAKLDDLLAQPGLGGFERADIEAARESRVRAEKTQERRGAGQRKSYEKATQVKRSTRKYQEQEALDRLSLDRRMAEKLTRTVSGLAVLTAGLSVVGMGMGLLLMPAIEMTTEWIEKMVQARKNIKEFKLNMLEFGHSIGETTERYEMFNKSMDRDAKLALGEKTLDEQKRISNLTEQQEIRRAFYQQQLERTLGMEGQQAADLSFAAFAGAEDMEPYFGMLGRRVPADLKNADLLQQQEMLHKAMRERITQKMTLEPDRLFVDEPSPMAMQKAGKWGGTAGSQAMAKWPGILDRVEDIPEMDSDDLERLEDVAKILNQWAIPELNALALADFSVIGKGTVESQEKTVLQVEALLDYLEGLFKETEVLARRQLRSNPDDAGAAAWLALIDQAKINISKRRTEVNAAVGRAKGGVVGMGETTLVGEDGPELVVLPGGSRVIPNGQFNVSTGINVRGYEREWRGIEGISSRYSEEIDSVVNNYLNNVADQWSFVWGGITRANTAYWMGAVGMSDSAERAALDAKNLISDITSADEEGTFELAIRLSDDDIDEINSRLEEALSVTIGEIEPGAIALIESQLDEVRLLIKPEMTQDDINEVLSKLDSIQAFASLVLPPEEAAKFKSAIDAIKLLLGVEVQPFVDPATLSKVEKEVSDLEGVVTVTIAPLTAMAYELLAEEMGEFGAQFQAIPYITNEDYDLFETRFYANRNQFQALPYITNEDYDLFEGSFYSNRNQFQAIPHITTEDYDLFEGTFNANRATFQAVPQLPDDAYELLREEMGEFEVPVSVRPRYSAPPPGPVTTSPTTTTSTTSTPTTSPTTTTTTTPTTTPHTSRPNFSPWTYSQTQVSAVAGGGMLGAGDYGLVGERGPELLRMPVRSFVQPNHNLINMLSQNMMQPSVEVTSGSGSRDLTVKLQIGTRDLKEVVLEIVNEELRHKSPNARSI